MSFFGHPGIPDYNLVIEELINNLLNLSQNQIDDLDMEMAIKAVSYIPVIKKKSQNWQNLYCRLIDHLDKGIPMYLKGKINDEKLFIRISQLFDVQTKLHDERMYEWTNE